MIPAMVVAIAMGRSGIDQLLVISQVVLSIVLPFVVFPLLWLTTNKKIMSVKKLESDLPASIPSDSPSSPDTPTPPKFVATKTGSPIEHDIEALPDGPAEIIDYSNGKIIAGLGYLIWAVVVVANVYVIVMLGLGKSG